MSLGTYLEQARNMMGIQEFKNYILIPIDPPPPPQGKK
jgi:hypothetical protein